MKKINLIAGLLLILGTAMNAQEKNSVMIIEEAVRDGKITYDESLRLKHLFLRNPKELPSEFRSDVPVKCAFGISNEIAMNEKKNSMLKIAKPASDFMHVHQFVCKGQTKTFHVYYDTTGTDAVPRVDLNSNGLPDWVEETALAFEKAYRTEVDTLGYREPLNFPIHGFYPVYINNQSGAYGGTTPDSQITSNPWTYTSYIEVDNDYIGNYYTHGYDALRVTCAHEFHHAVQLAYQNTYSDGDGWFYEVTSTWMEDVVYPEVNDYIDYLKYYFNQPHISLNVANGSHEYAMVIWNHYIQKKFNRLMIRKVWEKLPSMSALNGWNQTLQENAGSDLSQAFLEFNQWNYFTNYRSDTVKYYKEGYLYPSIKWQLTDTLVDSISFSNSLNISSSRWYRFILVDTINAFIRFNGFPSSAQFSVLTLIDPSDDEPGLMYFHNLDTLTFEDLLPTDTLYFSFINKNWNSSLSYSYQFSIKPTNFLDTIKPFPDYTDFKVYPNPVVGSDSPLKFSFRSNKDEEVSIDIYSISGKLIYRSKKEELSPSAYFRVITKEWNCRDLSGNRIPTGVYIYQIKAGSFSKTGKIAVIR